MLNTSPGVFFLQRTRDRIHTAAADCANEIVRTWLRDTSGDPGNEAARLELERRIVLGIEAAVQGVYKGLTDVCEWCGEPGPHTTPTACREARGAVSQ